jgi:hypothetical protein
MNRSAEDIPREATEAVLTREPEGTLNVVPEDGGEPEGEVEESKS